MIELKTEKEIEKMAEAGRSLASILQKLKARVRAGVKTSDLNKWAEELIAAEGGKPNFKNYQGFPATLCASINEVAVHQPPSEYRLQPGDILSLDLGLEKDGFQSDSAITVGVGKISSSAQKLLEVTEAALLEGIEAAQAGSFSGDIGWAVESYVKKQGFGVIRELTGHGIGRRLHENPTIFNFGSPGKGEKLKPGLVICIEPIVGAGSTSIEKGEDGFSYRSIDRSLTAHFEHMVAITSEGPRILSTLS
jgi:methionyl aminopeptidase